MYDPAAPGLTRGRYRRRHLQAFRLEGLQHLRQARLRQGEDDEDGIDLIDDHQGCPVGLDEGPGVGQVGPGPAGDGRMDLAIGQIQPRLFHFRLLGQDRLPQDHGGVGELLGLGARYRALGLQGRVPIRLVLGEFQLGLGPRQLGLGGAQLGLESGGVHRIEEIPGGHGLALLEVTRQDLAADPGQEGGGIGRLGAAHLLHRHGHGLGGDRQGDHGHGGRRGRGPRLLAGGQAQEGHEEEGEGGRISHGHGCQIPAPGKTWSGDVSPVVGPSTSVSRPRDGAQCRTGGARVTSAGSVVGGLTS